ncbi:ThuA domain-containing protein [Oerskovia sp. M15]
MPLTWDREDKWLGWADNPAGKVHTLAQLEPGPDAGPTTSPFEPVSWCRDYDGGRSFFTGMGGTAGAGPTRRSASTCSERCSGRPASCAATARRRSPRTTASSASRPRTRRHARPGRRAPRPDDRPRRHGLLRRARGVPDRTGRELGEPRRGPRLRHDPRVGPRHRRREPPHDARRHGQPGQRQRAREERGGSARHRPRPGLRAEQVDLRLLDAARVDRP